MTERFRPPSAAALARIRTMSERRLTAEEFRTYVEAPMSQGEREDVRALIRWFRRRYPTPLDRLRSARHAIVQSAWRLPR